MKSHGPPITRIPNLLNTMLSASLLLCVYFGPVSAFGAETEATVSSETLDAFMEKWSEYESFQVPMDPKDEPLLQAALKKDPEGPWATYLSMKFAETRFKARKLQPDDRAGLYRTALGFLKPARDTLRDAVKADPPVPELRQWLYMIEQHAAHASLEAGVDVASVKSFAEATLAQNKDRQSWNFGNMVFQAHTLLGRVALREGKVKEAKKHLLASGRTPGSPQLNAYGPDFILARELAEKGERNTVIEFLDAVEGFWAYPDGRTEAHQKRSAHEHLEQLESWIRQLRAGKVPDHPKWR